MAVRLQRWPEAEAHFKEALQLGVTDQFLLGAYADFLLQQKRPAEVLTLLAGWERSDILLLRLAMAGRALNDPRAAGWAAQLRDRFAAAAQRGDRLHEQEAARFELDIEGNPAKALDLASRNYKAAEGAARRRNPDARRARGQAAQGRAAGAGLASQPTSYEDPALACPGRHSWPRREPGDDALACHPRWRCCCTPRPGPTSPATATSPCARRRQRTTSPCAGTSRCATSTTCCSSTATATAS